MIRKIVIGNAKIFCFEKRLTKSDPEYNVLNGLTDLEPYIPDAGPVKELAANIRLVDMNDLQSFDLDVYKSHDLQIRVGPIYGPRDYLRKYIKIPGLNNLKNISKEQFDKYVDGDMVNLYVIGNNVVLAKYVKKNSLGDIKMENDIYRIIEEYARNNNIRIEDVDKVKLVKSFDNVVKIAKEKSELKRVADKLKEEEMVKLLNDAKKLAETIDMNGYIEILYQRIRQANYMYRKSHIINLINSIMTQQGADLRGLSGIGKDSIAKIFAMLSSEDYEYQVLEISASIGLELDDKRVLGYQDYFTKEYQDSNYSNHFKKSNKDQKKPFFSIVTEANLINLDKSFSPITSSMDSAFKKITRPRYGNVDSNTDKDPEFTDNNFMFLTTNEYIGRKDLSLKDKDRMMIIGYNDPYLRRIKDISGKYKPISPEPVLSELFKRHILNNEFRKMSIREAYDKNGNYKIWADKYNDVIVDLYDKLNNTLKRNHMENMQIANRLQDATNKYLFVATLLPIDERLDKGEYKDLAIDEKLILNQKLAFGRFLSQKFITKLEDATDAHLRGLKEIKEILSKESKSETGLLLSEDDCIKMLENIILRIRIYERSSDSELDFINQPEED